MMNDLNSYVFIVNFDFIKNFETSRNKKDELNFKDISRQVNIF